MLKQMPLCLLHSPCTERWVTQLSKRRKITPTVLGLFPAVVKTIGQGIRVPLGQLGLPLPALPTSTPS